MTTEDRIELLNRCYDLIDKRGQRFPASEGLHVALGSLFIEQWSADGHTDLSLSVDVGPDMEVAFSVELILRNHHPFWSRRRVDRMAANIELCEQALDFLRKHFVLDDLAGIRP